MITAARAPNPVSLALNWDLRHFSCSFGSSGSIRAGFVTSAAACWMYVGAVAEGMRKISYAGYRFPPEVIHQAIWLYLRFTLSFRDVEDLLASGR